MSKRSICTWKELQDYVAKLVAEHEEETGAVPTRVHLPKELKDKFYEHFHNEVWFLYENKEGKRCKLRIAMPISVS